MQSFLFINVALWKFLNFFGLQIFSSTLLCMQNQDESNSLFPQNPNRDGNLLATRVALHSGVPWATSMYWLFVEQSYTSCKSGILTVMISSWEAVSKSSNVWVFSGQKKLPLQTEFTEMELSMLISWSDTSAFEGTNVLCQISPVSAANTGLRTFSS